MSFRGVARAAFLLFLEDGLVAEEHELLVAFGFRGGSAAVEDLHHGELLVGNGEDADFAGGW